MDKYVITIKEMLEKEITVDADSELEAVDKVRDLYNSGKIDMSDSELSSISFDGEHYSLF